MNPPDQLAYSNIRPRGWYSKFKQWPIQPLSSNQYWNPNEIVRFQLMLTNGVMDPYRSSLNITVNSLSAAEMPIGGIQIDNSAQSFINQMVLTSNNIQVERIAQYDTLAAYLTDIGFSQTVCENRQWQGLGYQNHQISGQVNKQQYGQDFVSLKATSTVFEKACNGLSLTKTIPFAGVPSLASVQTGVYTYYGTPKFNFHCTPSHISNGNGFMNSGDNTQATAINQMQITRAVTGRLGNVRSQYVPQMTLRGQIDSTTSYRTQAFNLTNTPIPSTWNTNGASDTTKPYSPGYPSTATTRINNSGSTMVEVSTTNIGGIYGYTKPYSAKFGVGGFEPMLSSTIPQAQFGYGQVSATPVPISTRRFQFPLLSSVMGVLLPADQFKLIPLKALYNALIELTLNPYAMFSTGRMDTYQFDTTGVAKQIPRTYQISRFVYNIHIYQWPQQDAGIWINENLQKEIAITGSSWFLSSQYQIANGQQVRNNWQINTTSQSLGQIVCLFLSNQYMKYSYCRKQFRLSNNIRSMQLKFNTDYFPPQPIVGNAGNPFYLDSTGDNTDFLELLLLANDYKFATNTPHPRINSYNFAINARCYDPSNTKTLYPNSMLSGAITSMTASDFNTDTAMGLSWFHQNRFIGKAAFVYSFQPYGHSKHYMTGLNTMNARPFDVLFDCGTTNYFPSDQTLYIFSRANVINVYSDNGIRVIGR